MSLTFDPVQHHYFLDGERLPSVSEIKSPLTDFSMVAPDVMARASAYGTAVHKMVELYLSNELDYGSLDENLFGPLEAFERWLSETKPFENQKGVLVDVKSRKFDRVSDPLQLAAYYELWKENRETLGTEPIIEKPMASTRYRFAGTPDIIIPPKDAEDFTDLRILYLGRDGKYQYTPCYDRNAWPMFGRLLGDYYHARETEKLIHSWRNR